MHTHTLWAARVAAGTVLPDKRLPARLASILETFAGSVSKVEMATPMALTCKVLFLSISTFETLPKGGRGASSLGYTEDFNT